MSEAKNGKCGCDKYVVLMFRSGGLQGSGVGTYDNVRWAHLSHGARSHSRHHLTTCSRSSIDMATYNKSIYLLATNR